MLSSENLVKYYQQLRNHKNGKMFSMPLSLPIITCIALFANLIQEEHIFTFKKVLVHKSFQEMTLHASTTSHNASNKAV